MSSRDRIILIMNLSFIILFFLLIAADVKHQNALQQIEQTQGKINAATYERNERQDQELRLIKQDMEIYENIILSKTYLEEEEE